MERAYALSYFYEKREGVKEMFKKKETHDNFEYNILKKSYAKLEKENKQLSAKLQIAEKQKNDYEKLAKQVNLIKEQYEEKIKELDKIKDGYQEALDDLQQKLEDDNK